VTLKDGWLDLPSGGAVEVRDGVPVRVTDNGNYRLDDWQILREAAAATNTELTFRRQGRSERWRKRGIGQIFDARGIYRPEVADVLRNACTACGSAVGEEKVTPDNGGPVEWACRQCAHAMIAHHLDPDTAVGFTCDGSCGAGAGKSPP